MTKEEFMSQFVESDQLTWDKIRDIDLDYMYNNLQYIDSEVALMFDVPMETVIRKRKELSISIKRDDHDAFQRYKQQGYLKWDEINYDRFDYLYNICNYTDSIIAGLFDVPKRTVTTKRKELGITLLDSGKVRNDVSSYLDFLYAKSSDS